MNDRLIVAFDKSSQGDIPVLVFAGANLGGSPSIVVKEVFTGDEAVALWDKLRKKEKNHDNNSKFYKLSKRC